MLRNFKVALYLLCMPLCLSAESGFVVKDGIVDETSEATETQAVVDVPEVELQNGNGVEEAIQEYERRASIAEKSDNHGILPEDEVEKLYESMVRPLEDIINILKEPTNVYKFIEAKGIERVILPHLHIFNTDLRTRLLELTKLLFDVAPTTTTVMIPSTMLDKLLDIFEDDDNLALKARTVDILNIWLPNNPKIQARVMKLKGLEPFYDQVNKLDPGVTHTLLQLFNKILTEHLKARNEVAQKSKTDFVRLNTYKKIGLVERVSSENVCHGLLNIFRGTWASSLNNEEFMLPVFEILKNVQPFCVDHYKGKANALELFQAMLKHVKESAVGREGSGLNATDLELVLRGYVDKLSLSIKDEF